MRGAVPWIATGFLVGIVGGIYGLFHGESFKFFLECMVGLRARGIWCVGFIYRHQRANLP
jgi:hypothetical protein